MTNEQLLEVTKQLITIESIAAKPEKLQEACDFMIDFLQRNSKDITIERFDSGGKPSLLAYSGAARPDKFHIVLNGHLDVVPGSPEQYQPVVKDGKLFGRGVYDMKAAAVILASVFCEFVDRVPFPLALQLVTDEESAGKHGTLHQIASGVRGDFVICGECGRATDSHEIANKAKGILLAEIGFNGKSAHGAYPWKGDNAILHAHRFLNKLHQEYPAPTAATDESTITVTAFSAVSGAHTRIPDHAIVRLDCRYLPNDPNLSDVPRFTAFLKRLDPMAEVIDFFDFSSPLYSDPENPLLQALKESAETVENAPFSFVQRHATSDGRHYGDVGNQACEFGIAGEHQHGDDEHITLDAFANYHATMRHFLDKVRQS